MYDETNAFHHIEIHTINSNYLLNLFLNVYDFQLIAKRVNLYYSQWFLKSSECQLIISSTLNLNEIFDYNDNNQNHYDILTSILNNKTTRDFIINRDTVFNVALHVKSIQTILEKNSDIEVIVSRRQATDEYGSIEYACIKSCVGNVVHTLIDTSQYSGFCLPGFIPEKLGSSQRLVKGIDHVAFAMPRNSAIAAISWYEKIFGMKRFIINKEDDPFQGFPVHVGTMGMRLFASEYWKCAETACINQSTSNLKFVFAESLIDNSRDQITTFITQHNNQAGIQHLGFTCIKNINDAVRVAKANGAQFLTPCANYYLKQNNGLVIEAAGENVNDLAELGILLDDEADKSKSDKRILLQIFTKSIFNNDTFFLEFIERRGATGFGAGNIRTLWKIVQEQLN